ncbi:MAG: S9 family peptidase [Xanthomonadales bacterium]|nr:S9 family peptidase [Xanthomonadales bacterium]
MPRLLLLLAALAAAPAASARPFDAEILVRLARVGEPRLSPDGRLVAYVLRETDWEKNRGMHSIWIVPADGSRPPRRLSAAGSNATQPRFAPDGGSLYFLSDRSGSQQLWRLPLEGGEAVQVSDYPLDVGTYLISPRGDAVALSFEVFPDCATLACTRERLDERAKGKASGVLHERLFVRHWDRWKDGRRSQLFLAELRDGRAGEPRPLSAGLDGDVPSKPFGGAEEIAFAPDGRSLVFAARVAGREEAWSTNLDLWRVRLEGEPAPENLTPDRPGTDTTPAFSPDGRLLVWTAMPRAGYESDRLAIMARDLASGRTWEVAPGWDRSAHGLAFSGDGRRLYTYAEDLGHRRLFEIELATGRVRALSGDGSVGAFAAAGSRVVFVRDDLANPAELFVLDRPGASPRRLTEHNAELLREVRFGDYEQFSFEGAAGRTVYGWVVKPVGFEPGRRYPIAFLVHGGPQGSMGNAFHYRWNPQTYAGQGFAAVFIDFHGSTGYGQAFTDAINRDWGGKPLEDLKLGLAAALKRFPFLDGERACALGASYGGYMINWIAGAWPEGFRCLVNHCGVFDLRSMYYSTEELWFVEWEFGAPQFADPEAFERHNPVRLVSRWRTPMLVIHGANDFRVPLEQGLAAFTALQRRGIPSQLLVFPDEGHWVLKPQNSLQWHRTVEAWLKRWTAVP